MEILVLVLLLLLSALFSGTETAYFFLDEKDRARLPVDHGRGGAGVAALLDDPSRLLAALLVGNLLVNTLANVVATSALVARFGPAGLAVAVPVMTVLLLVAGEITPKLVALRSPPRVALAMRPLLRTWMIATAPLLRILTAGTDALLARLPREGRSGGALSEEELVEAAGLAVLEASLTETEGRFLSRLVILEQLEVREIMSPRPVVRALSRDMGREAILAVAVESGFNRYPVMGEGDDRPEGVVHLKDLLGRTGDAPLAGTLREPHFVPETKSAAALLREMKAGVTHMAVVVDEHGDYTGIVTLEDCLEVLTGPWTDETDRGAPDVLPVADGNWVVAGMLDLRQLNEEAGTRIATTHDYVTLGGYVMAEIGRIPERGDRFTRDGFRFTVLEMDGMRVASVRVQDLEDERGGERS